MFKNRVLVVIAVLSLLLVAMAVSLPLSNTLVSANSNIAPAKYANADYHQRHPEVRLSAGVPANEMSDYFQRHPELSASVEIDRTRLYQNYPGVWVSRAAGVDMPLAENQTGTDYFQRHPELRTPIESDDLSDYFLRH